MKSPSWESSSSPMGVSSDTGSWERTLHADELIDGLDHVHGNTNGAGLVGDGARNGLTNPPRGVRGELEALGVVELFDSADKAEVAFLDEVEEEHAATDIALGDGDDESQVGADELLLGLDADLLDLGKTTQVGAGKLDAVVMSLVELAGSLQTGLDLHGEVDLVGGGQKVDLANLLEVHAHRIARELGRLGRLVATRGMLAALLAGNLGDGCIAELGIDDGGLGGVDLLLDLLLGERLLVLLGDFSRAGGRDLDASAADLVIDDIELIGVDVDVGQGNLNLVFRHRTEGLARRNELLDSR